MSAPRPRKRRPSALGDHATGPQGRDPRDQGGDPGAHRGLGPHGRGGLGRRHGAADRAGRRDRGAKRRGESIWPVIDYADIAAGTVPPEALEHLHRRGCVVVRGTFEREQALAWDRDIVDYVEGNRFFDDYRGPGDDFFGSVGSRPEIYPVYWSKAQMEARQSDRMAGSSRSSTTSGPTSPTACSGSTPTGFALPRPHPPPPARRGLRRPRRPPRPRHARPLDDEAYQQAFRHLFDGSVERYDPWDAAHRTDGPQYPGTTMCSVFRTFQGWTALSDMATTRACSTPSRSPRRWRT